MSSDHRDRPQPDDDWHPRIRWTPGELAETRPEGIAAVPGGEPTDPLGGEGHAMSMRESLRQGPVVPPPPADDEEPPVRFEPFEQPPSYHRPHPKGGLPRGLPRSATAVPDMVFDGADYDGLTVRAASLRGDDHRYYGEPRQDAVALWPVSLAGTDAVAVCVADGVGSQPLAHEGAALACRLFRDEVERVAASWAWDAFDELAAGITAGVADGMARYAAEARADLKTLSTTLVAAVVDAGPGDEPRRAVMLSVGDSAAYWLHAGKLAELMRDETAPGGGIVDPRTAALPGDPAAVRTVSGWLNREDVLVLCTDGLSNPMHGDEVRDRLVASWSGPEVPGIIEFGWQLAFRAKSYGDDRSAVCVWGR
ncbi:protein phosphatase 2C domain-containing protein [Actinomadura algeriensis]|uniref:Serine/threonine protein phosphatase PrpC n=1 Tax=Actinomadura algeriensis TaxID=1679523 RepID=A0ABR9K424_9ACTN|nr:protein phosphatase 2C domain-containing protein [Actinomadura algeriensis]MBE1537596.1 serine/threonine protein phosphatase PrpC [Actinomadura algeriensis]